VDLIYGPRNGPHTAEDLVLDSLISGQPRVRPHMRTSYSDIVCEPEFLDLKYEPRKVDPQISVFFCLLLLAKSRQLVFFRLKNG